jgi:hypothetical protein
MAADSALELAPPGAETNLELGVERIEPEEVTMRSMPGRRAWTAPAADPKVVAPLGKAPLRLVQAAARRADVPRVNVPRGASGSSTISASACVPAGTAVQNSAGETSSPSQVWRRGISSPYPNASLPTANSPTQTSVDLPEAHGFDADEPRAYPTSPYAECRLAGRAFAGWGRFCADVSAPTAGARARMAERVQSLEAEPGGDRGARGGLASALRWVLTRIHA